jgi:1-acyl-sn-glycerol-3-phosphate acyltransferase
VYLSILGAAWFWFYGVSLLTLFPTYCKDILHGDEQMATFFLALFSIGIGVGSLLCERLSFGKLELGLVPIGSVGMTLFLLDLYFVGSPYGLEKPDTLVGVIEFFRVAPASWRITFDLVFLSLFCGLYIVPLNTLIQQRSEASHRSRIISGFNVLSAVFMVTSSIMLIAFNAQGMPIPYIFLTIAIMNFAIALYIYLLIPEFLYRFLCWVTVNVWYRFRGEHGERIPEEGAALLVCNHVSFVDWMLIAAIPRRPSRFVMHYSFMKIPLFNWLCKQGNIIPIASKKEDPKVLEEAYKQIAEELDNGNMVCIFPEGQITKDGEMNTFRPGVERILERNPVPVYPLALRGMWGSFFSRKHGNAMSKPKFSFRKRITLVAGEAVPPTEATAELLQEKVLALRGDER